MLKWSFIFLVIALVAALFGFGVPVAMLVPIPESRKSDTQEVVRQLKELRRQVRLEGLSLREMIEEGRRS